MGNTLDDEEFFRDIIQKMGKRGYFPVAVVFYKTDAPENEAVRVSCPVDFYTHKNMRPVVTRMLKNAATILEAGGDNKTVERI